MNTKHLLSLANRLQESKTAVLCLSAGFCYLLAGQPQKTYAAFKENQEPKRKRQNVGKLIAELDARCSSKSLLDKLKRQPKEENLLELPDESAFMVGADNCPGLNIPAGNSFTDTGTTVGANNTVNGIQAGCSAYSTVAGPDVVYRFALPPLASRIPTCSITVTPTGGTGYDTSIYILRTTAPGCPTGTGNTVSNCAVGSDAGSFNAPETISDAQLDSLPAGQYFLFVDSFYAAGSAGQPNRHNGAYSLNFSCTTVAVPSAAGVSVGGRVISGNGGISRVGVSITDSRGQMRYATTNSFGFYKFDDLPAGETYLIEVSSKKYQFSNPTRIISVTENITDLDFTTIE